MEHDERTNPQPSRRRFLTTTVGLGAASAMAPAAAARQLWSRADRIPAGSRRATISALEQFPGDIPLFQQNFRNWSGGIQADDVWTCQPSTPKDVIKIRTTIQNGIADSRRRCFVGKTPKNILPLCVRLILMHPQANTMK